jgi:hypothetical protein
MVIAPSPRCAAGSSNDCAGSGKNGRSTSPFRSSQPRCVVTIAQQGQIRPWYPPSERYSASQLGWMSYRVVGVRLPNSTTCPCHTGPLAVRLSSASRSAAGQTRREGSRDNCADLR